MSSEDIKNIFMPRLEKAAALMIRQITAALRQNLVVKVSISFINSSQQCLRHSTLKKPFQNVILIGGFAASPSLANYLRQKLEDMSRGLATPIPLLRPRIP
jgi:hypothetical protein